MKSRMALLTVAGLVLAAGAGADDPKPAAPVKPNVKLADVQAAQPKVEPGKVKWHQDFAVARKAAEQSGKPVFLFQLLGRLDEEFV